MRRVRADKARVCFTALVLGAALSLVAMPSALAVARAQVSSPTFTWTGADIQLATPNHNWSDGNNWVGGVAPFGLGPVNVVFSAGSAACAACGSSTDDVTGLTVGSLTFNVPNFAASVQSTNLQVGAITITGSVNGTQPTGVVGIGSLSLPDTPEAWTVSGAQVTWGGLTGGGSTLSVVVGGYSTMTNFSGGANLSQVTLTGAVPSAPPATNGTLPVFAPGAPTLVSDLAIGIQTGTGFGPFTTAGDTIDASVEVGFHGLLSPITYNMAGALTLDPASSFTYHGENNCIDFGVQCEQSFPEVTATTAALNNAQLALAGSAGCPNEVDTLISAPSGLSGVFTQNLGSGPVPINNGNVVSGSGCDWRINYTATTVTASPLGVETINLGTSHTPALPGEAISYTATVSPPPDGGPVAFTDNSTPIPGCTASPVNPANAMATCTQTYAAPGTHVISAMYLGDANSPPSNTATLTEQIVPAPTATITTGSGEFNLPEVIQGSASDAGGPGIGEVFLYYYDYTGTNSGVVVANCTSCGPGQTGSTWSFTLPANGTPGIYAFAAQALDVGNNFGPASNVIYQVDL
jgi:hypothetical protein